MTNANTAAQSAAETPTRKTAPAGLAREQWAEREPLPLQTGEYFSRSLNRVQPYAWFAPVREQMANDRLQRTENKGQETDAPSAETGVQNDELLIHNSSFISPHSSLPLLVLLHGMGGGFRDWPDNTRLARYAAAYNMVIAFPDGGDGWYTNAANGGEGATIEFAVVGQTYFRPAGSVPRTRSPR